MSAASFKLHLTLFEKSGGPLTKRISLTPDGSVKSDGSACVMARGWAERIILNGIRDLAKFIASLRANEALGLGILRGDLPARVEVTTKQDLARNGASRSDLIARSGEFIIFEAGKPGPVLLDFDAKTMPQRVADEINRCGGFWPAIVSVLPALAKVAHVGRHSTSAGLLRTDTGAKLPGSGGIHEYPIAADAADVPRFLEALHDKCWLAGLGWFVVGVSGQLLNRSMIDRSVGQPERLVFEGPPVLVPPLGQDMQHRQPVVTDGELLDTLAACPPLTIRERSKLKQMQAAAAQQLEGERAKARALFIEHRSNALAAKKGVHPTEVRHVVERQCDGNLLPAIELPFDDGDFAGCTVADVIADPERFVGATLADPLEGVEYGRGKAKVMRRADGSLWINSFAHGRTVYELRQDAAAIKKLVDAAADADAVALFVKLAVENELDEQATDVMRDVLAKRCGGTKNGIARALKAERQQRTKRRLAAKRQQQDAERTDPRPRLWAPALDAPFLPVMAEVNEVLATTGEPEPPTRDVDGAFTKVRVRRLPEMHALTAQSANAAATPADYEPAPEQPLLTRYTEEQMAEEIERHIEYRNSKTLEPVHIHAVFVRHYLVRHDDALPLVAAVATLPLVLPGSQLLAPRGLDRERGVIFRIPPWVLDCLPDPARCDANAAAAALAFLTDEWLVDVATTFEGKCTLVALAMSVIQRSLLPNRPAFWVIAPQRGGGKTTAIVMVMLAVTGIWPAAAAWSPSEEERKKALFSYLDAGGPAIVWDNIPQGELISCPHIERSCTTLWYSDRRLGVSEIIATSAATIHIFTGNNCGSAGDLRSRSIDIPLVVDRIDPENRAFKHPDPIAWTLENRRQILRALYTLLLTDSSAPPGQQLRTRFKVWWWIVGAPLEAAAKAGGEHLDFGQIFAAQEAEAADVVLLGDVLGAMLEQWFGLQLTALGGDLPALLAQRPAKALRSQSFTARDLAGLLTRDDQYAPHEERERAALLREFLFPNGRPNAAITAKAVGDAMRKCVGTVAMFCNRTLQLVAERDSHTKIATYHVRTV